jgi:hypothetical protein
LLVAILLLISSIGFSRDTSHTGIKKEDIATQKKLEDTNRVSDSLNYAATYRQMEQT